MDDVVCDLFSWYLGGLNTKGNPQLGNFGLLARNTKTGNWVFAGSFGSSEKSKLWNERYDNDETFIHDRANDNMFESDPLQIGDIVVERDMNLQEHWPECWWHKYLEKHSEIREHLCGPPVNDKNNS